MTSAASAVVVTACVSATAAHGYVFARESLLFSRPSTQRMFEVAAADVGAVRLWAFHQGVYNLLLGATSLAGAIGVLAGASTAGPALVVASSTSMIVAAVTLVAADPRRARIPGLVAQALPPSVALLALTLA
jgi:putative membrane protein